MKQRAIHCDPRSGVARVSKVGKSHLAAGRSAFPRQKRVSVAALSVVAVPIISGIEGLAGPARALALGLAYFAILGVLAARKRVRVPTPVMFLFGFGLVAAASALVSVDPKASLLRAGAFLALIICAFLAAEASDSSRLAASAFVLFPASLSALALALAIFLPSFVFAEANGFPRLSLPLFSLHPNTLGAIVAIGVVVAIGRARAHAARRWVWLAVLALELPVLLLTYSRSSLLDVFVGLLVFAYVTRRATPAILFTGCVAVLLTATVGDALLSLVLRGQEIAAIEGLSGRRDIWGVALEAWRASPLIGLGYGEGAATVLESSGLYLSYSVSTTDSFFLDALLETGSVGAVMVLGIYVSVFRGIWVLRRAQAPHRSTRRLGAEFAAVSAMILVHALGSGGVGRFHVLAVLMVFAVVGLWRSSHPCAVGTVHPGDGAVDEPSDTARTSEEGSLPSEAPERHW